mmetsp:Transcript_18229/g.46004  ORF Transcript_18229/g.46004 Transcript_18229/m.46004 type:complete len:278 (+) Transcript_18229:244-1077(+)
MCRQTRSPYSSPRATTCTCWRAAYPLTLPFSRGTQEEASAGRKTRGLTQSTRAGTSRSVSSHTPSLCETSGPRSSRRSRRRTMSWRRTWCGPRSAHTSRALLRQWSHPMAASASRATSPWAGRGLWPTLGRMQGGRCTRFSWSTRRSSAGRRCTTSWIWCTTCTCSCTAGSTGGPPSTRCSGMRCRTSCRRSWRRTCSWRPTPTRCSTRATRHRPSRAACTSALQRSRPCSATHGSATTSSRKTAGASLSREGLQQARVETPTCWQHEWRRSLTRWP